MSRCASPTAPIQPRGPIAQARTGVRHFIRRRDGSAAVEFAMVGLPFVALLMGCLELALLLTASTNLDNATASASRTIRTGVFQTTAGTEQQFKDAICKNMSWLQNDCLADLTVDVRVLANFSSPPPSPVQNGVFVDPNAFTPGCPGEIVEIRSFYKWNLIAPSVTQAVSNIGGGQYLMTSTYIFRNEPYANTC